MRTCVWEEWALEWVMLWVLASLSITCCQGQQDRPYFIMFTVITSKLPSLFFSFISSLCVLTGVSLCRCLYYVMFQPSSVFSLGNSRNASIFGINSLFQWLSTFFPLVHYFKFDQKPVHLCRPRKSSSPNVKI